jgi:hypothetical protein
MRIRSAAMRSNDLAVASRTGQHREHRDHQHRRWSVDTTSPICNGVQPR